MTYVVTTHTLFPASQTRTRRWGHKLANSCKVYVPDGVRPFDLVNVWPSEVTAARKFDSYDAARTFVTMTGKPERYQIEAL